MVIKEIEVKDIMTKTNLPVSHYAVNPYVGCTHACKYCYASFMKRFTNHPEPWGEFVDVKSWPEIHKPGKYAGKEAFFCSVTDPPGITDVIEIIERAKDQCNLVWPENLNLRRPSVISL